jgi:capsular exopolysaccharide synthesis family protein
VTQVKVTNPTGTVILQVSASASTPEAARDLAEAWLHGVVAQVEKIESADGKTPPVTIIPGDSARLPTAPSSPNAGLNLALGALVGLLLGVGYAVVRDRMDRRIRSPEGVEAATGVSVVGALPLEPALSKGSSLLPLASEPGDHREWAALAETFRGLRTNLQYMSVDDPPRAIVVTSPLPGDGKSFTAANLAITIAASGQPVVLIDGDLRRPRIASLFGLPEGAGLSDILAGRAEPFEVLQPTHDTGNLMVLGAGPIPPNPSEILGSERMRHLVGELSSAALVIIDSPPLLPVTDAAVLSTRADGALVVVNTGRTTYEVLEHALDLLDKAKGHALGIVLNRVPTSGAGAARYGYQYIGDYYRPTPKRAANDKAAA